MTLKNAFEGLATETKQDSILGAVQGQLSTGIYNNDNAKINPATAEGQLPDGHNVSISDVNDASAQKLGGFAKNVNITVTPFEDIDIKQWVKTDGLELKLSLKTKPQA